VIDHKISAGYQLKVLAFVDQNVYYCVSSLCSAILGHVSEEGQYQEEATNLLCGQTTFVPYHPKLGEGLEFGTEEEAQEWVDSLCVAHPEDYEIEERQSEIFEHWIVSSYFGEKLREKGEVVESIHDVLIWGRTTTGQSIMLDGVVQSIYEELHA